MIRPTIRLSFAFILCSVIGLMGYGLYTQYFDHLRPCPLCMTQRVFYCLIGAFALLGLIHLHGRRIYAFLIMLAAIGGAGAAGRQTWLQHLPADQVPACGPSLEYMLSNFPFSEALQMLLLGDGNCAEVDWQFLGFSMAEWSLLWFVGFGIFGLWLLLRRD